MIAPVVASIEAILVLLEVQVPPLTEEVKVVDPFKQTVWSPLSVPVLGNGVTVIVPVAVATVQLFPVVVIV